MYIFSRRHGSSLFCFSDALRCPEAVLFVICPMMFSRLHENAKMVFSLHQLDSAAYVGSQNHRVTFVFQVQILGTCLRRLLFRFFILGVSRHPFWKLLLPIISQIWHTAKVLKKMLLRIDSTPTIDNSTS